MFSYRRRENIGMTVAECQCLTDKLIDILCQLEICEIGLGLD